QLDDLEEGRKVRLHEVVQPFGLELLGELGVAGDVEEKDQTSTFFFSSSVAFGFCSSKRLTDSGTNFDSSPLSCSSSSRRWRDSWRLCSAVTSSVFLDSSSV